MTMGLLLLGIVVNPVLASIGDIHESNHAAHGLQADPHPYDGAGTSSADHAAQAPHADDVWHGLMHACHTHGPTTTGSMLAVIAAVPGAGAVIFPATAPLTPRQHIAGPFRPPIA